MLPSGSSTQVVEEIYEEYYATYLDRIPVRAWQIDWDGPVLQAVVWGAVLIAFFYVFARYFNRPHHERGELYRPVSFGGQLYERAGQPSRFSWTMIVSVSLWGLYYVAAHALTGQIY